MMRYDANAAAGLRETRKVRAFPRPIVSLYEAGPAGLDVGCVPWATVCETHGTMVGHDTLEQARRGLASPFEWCADCQDAREAEAARREAEAAR
jgi:hypothetical protein